MITLHTQHLKTAVAAILAGLVLAALAPSLMAQGNGVDLRQTAEIDIGIECPVTAALDPAGTTLWILMDNCFQGNHALHAYDVASGSRVTTDDYAVPLQVLDGVYVDQFITPLGFTPAGDLSIRFNDPDTYASANLLIPLAGGKEAVLQTSAAYDALLAQYSDYPEFSVYSPDHTRVVASGSTSLHVIDIQAETEIATIEVEGGTDYVQASFSADGQRLHVTRLSNPDDFSDNSATLLLYSLPDGALLQEYALPSSAAWVSPDGTRAAMQFFSNNIGERSELVILDLESGLTSPASSLLEAPAPVTNCVNDGRDVSDLGFTSSGYLSLSSLHWLPDSSGLALTLSYMGEGAQGDTSVCIFNYSRLRTYQVGGAGG